MEFINVLFLSIFFYFTTQATGSCPFDSQRPKIIAIGRPFGSIKTTWYSVNSTGLPVTYQVHFNKTSPHNHCENPMTDALYTANHCTQSSSKGGILHECDLTEDVKKMNMDFQANSLCVVISILIYSTNKTCYSLYKEYNPFLETAAVICPAPDIQVLSPEPGKLTINWNVSRKFIGHEAMKDMSFIINYEPVRPSSTCTIKETKTLSALNYDFVYEHNTHSIDNLESCCPYRVTTCCTFSTGIPECNPKYISEPSYVTTAEHVPLSAPQIENYAVQNKNLFMKWKIPSNVSCKDNVTEYEINYWEDFHDNCSSSSSSSSSVLKYFTNKTNDREATISGVLPSTAYCFYIRMCRHPGCSPWSMIYSVKDTTQTTIKNTPSGDKLTNTGMIAMLNGLGTLVLVLTILLICLIKRRNGTTRPRRLEDTVGELDGATDLLESSQSTAEMDSDYATA